MQRDADAVWRAAGSSLRCNCRLPLVRIPQPWAHCTGADQLQQWFKLFRLESQALLKTKLDVVRQTEQWVPASTCTATTTPSCQWQEATSHNSDCAIRRLALHFATGLLPAGTQAHAPPLIFDGLELGTRCNDTRPPIQVPTVPNRGFLKGPSYTQSDSGTEVYVDYGEV